MCRFSVVVAVSAFAILLAASGAWAVMDNITIPDNMSTGTGWYGPQENQEVEPGMTTGQPWDLEAFLFDKTIPTRELKMVGGWDFRSGVDGWASGDVFLAVESIPNYGSTAIHGPGNPGVPAPHLVGGKWYSDFGFGYTYALDINWGSTSATSFTYNVFKLPPLGAVLEVADVAYAPPTNEGSNPYRYNTGGDLVGSGVATWALEYSDIEGAHYSMTFDLSGDDGYDPSWLFDNVSPEADLYTHFTMQCGNDDLMGYVENFSVPEPISMVMLGCLGAGMFGVRKARQWRKAAK